VATLRPMAGGRRSLDPQEYHSYVLTQTRHHGRGPKSGAGAVEISEFSGYGKGKVPATLVKLPLLEFVK